MPWNFILIFAVSYRICEILPWKTVDPSDDARTNCHGELGVIYCNCYL